MKPTELTAQRLLDLFNNKIPYIQIDDFLSPKECEMLCTAVYKHGLGQYDYQFDTNDAPPAQHLFDTHYLYEDKTPEEYFPVAQKSIQEYRDFCKDAKLDAVENVRKFLEVQMKRPVEIASQDGKQYTHAIIRELKSSALLHADFAGFLPSYWSISNVIAEYAWNIYLSDPGEGGECLVYNKFWEKEDDKHILKGTYGYDEVIVKNKDFATISVKPGQLVFFNSRNFHKVNASTKPRLSIGGHVGLTNEEKVLMWV